AQAVQAFAARVSPHVDMNPVLLKPGSDQHSHVVHCGRDIGPMTVREYHQTFSQHRQVALDAYDRLAAQAGIMVMEGAGGIAEINLRDRDLSNREAPLYADAKILLVGDIERGGVFASLLGSWMCLEHSLQKRVAGFVINRFRGDASLLDSGIAELQTRTGVPTLGVLPWRDDLCLGDEDSMNLLEEDLPDEKFIRIGVIHLPHLSNSNDWAPLKQMPGVAVFLSRNPQKLQEADALILPGTRTTLADLRWLKQHHLDLLLQDWKVARRPLLAICGGMQMLGTGIADPDGVEEPGGGEMPGLGLLPIRTEFQSKDKIVQPRRGTILKSARESAKWMTEIESMQGYEIHSGTSKYDSASAEFQPWLQNANGESEGWMDPEGSFLASYWHGMLHRPKFAQAWVNFVAQKAHKEIHFKFCGNENAQYECPTFLRPGLKIAEDWIGRSLSWTVLAEI
ncbi:MAG TPA: cobyric acid synthase, partial [Fibrobacteraceae bacterium]|nr:cobyric acid synthase [Fibrobacteraceae bacterium]